MRLVILESPFAGKGSNWIVRLWNRWMNIRYARAAMRDCLLKGDSPMASHLLYTQPGVLDDDQPDERQLGISAGLEWGRKAEATIVYIDRGISSGMKHGIRHAKEAVRPIVFRHLPGWSAEAPDLARLRVEYQLD